MTIYFRLATDDRKSGVGIFIIEDNMTGLATEETTKTPTPRMSKDQKLTRVTQLRDAAIKIVQQKGEWKPFGADVRVMQFECDKLSIWYTALPYGFGVDIWDAGSKVLNVQWNDAGVSVISFRRGDWESEVLEAYN
jgi:hypothetical protein